MDKDYISPKSKEHLALRPKEEAAEYSRLAGLLMEKTREDNIDYMKVANRIVGNLPPIDTTYRHNPEGGVDPLKTARIIAARTAVAKAQSSSFESSDVESTLKRAFYAMTNNPVMAEQYTDRDIEIIQEKTPLFLEQARNAHANKRMLAGMSNVPSLEKILSEGQGKIEQPNTERVKADRPKGPLEI